jgi:hypothetical protein
MGNRLEVEMLSMTFELQPISSKQKNAYQAVDY